MQKFNFLVLMPLFFGFILGNLFPVNSKSQTIRLPKESNDVVINSQKIYDNLAQQIQAMLDEHIDVLDQKVAQISIQQSKISNTQGESSLLSSSNELEELNNTRPFLPKTEDLKLKYEHKKELVDQYTASGSLTEEEMFELQLWVSTMNDESSFLLMNKLFRHINEGSVFIY
ncbi:MAG: hypothetical protein HOO06_03315 [Bdellovibrionaceae bacterium]|nr:hypothetical protein [Pseudobdellovibrionaceae bacterium]